MYIFCEEIRKKIPISVEKKIMTDQNNSKGILSRDMHFVDLEVFVIFISAVS